MDLKLCVFSVQEKDQRSLDLNTAKCMLGLLLGKTWPLFPVFNQFLEVRALFRYYIPNSLTSNVLDQSMFHALTVYKTVTVTV